MLWKRELQAFLPSLFLLSALLLRHHDQIPAPAPRIPAVGMKDRAFAAGARLRVVDAREAGEHAGVVNVVRLEVVDVGFVGDAEIAA